MTPFLGPAQNMRAAHARPTRRCLPSSDLPLARGLILPLRYLRALFKVRMRRAFRLFEREIAKTTKIHIMLQTP
jgi:hypothetical protein